MHRIYLGVSNTLKDIEIMKYFDIDPGHPDLISRFERAFGVYIGEGKSEVYGKYRYPDKIFDADFFQSRMPFTAEKYILDLIDFDTIISAFFIEVDKSIEVVEADGITLVGEMLIEKYDFEK